MILGPSPSLLFTLSNAIENDRRLGWLEAAGRTPYHLELLGRTFAVPSDVRSDIIEHLDDPKRQKNIIWIRGPSGSGKSTLLLKIAAILRDRDQLGYYFDFDHCLSGTGIGGVCSLWCSVGYNLASRYPAAKRCILSLLQPLSLFDFQGLDSGTIFDSLVRQPLIESAGASCLPPVFIIDGLDRCDNPDDRCSLLTYLERWSQLSPEFKIIVASRNEEVEEDIFFTLDPISYSIDLTSEASTT